MIFFIGIDNRLKLKYFLNPENPIYFVASYDNLEKQIPLKQIFSLN